MAKRRGSGRATINDVAKKAQVGAITVSRMLRDPSKVSPELRGRIEAAIKDLNYIPDPKARALASGQANVIGVLIPSLSNIVFSDMLRGIHDVLADTGYQAQIGNTRYSREEEDRLVSLFVGQRPAAMIVTGTDQSAQSRDILANAGVPVVQVIELGPDPIDMMIGLSHTEAAETVVAHLHDQGYRRIGFVVARKDPRAFQRLAGYRSAMARLGLAEAVRVAETERASSVACGRELLGDLLDSHPDTNAVFCANDDLAMGALFECMARGISVPGQLGITGFNDLDMMAAAVPGLTSVRTNRYEIGEMAARMVLDRLRGKAVDRKVVDLGYELVARDSTRR